MIVTSPRVVSQPGIGALPGQIPTLIHNLHALAHSPSHAFPEFECAAPVYESIQLIRLMSSWDSLVRALRPHAHLPLGPALCPWHEPL